MKNQDDALQDSLEALEAGTPLSEVLSRMSVEHTELAPLVQLAGTVHSTAHPRVSPARALEDKRRLMNITSTRTRPTNRRWFSAPIAFGAAAVMIALVFGFYSIFSNAGRNAARLANVSGLVEVASSATAEDWRIVESGDTLNSGERLRTYEDSSATLTFAEGSRTVIGANADVTLSALKSGWGGTIDVDLMQHAGKTSHHVVPFGDKNSAFVVHTPSGEARVHGTAFDVAIGKTGLALFSVTTGKVEVNNAGQQIFLLPGQASLANGAVSLEDPAYTFNIHGTVQAMDAATLTVEGVKISTHALTQVTGTFAVGSTVDVSGRIVGSGQWLADSITVVTENEPGLNGLSFTGAVESMAGSEWVISGNKVLVNSATTHNPDLKEGDAVKVTFRVLDDGTWLAVDIERLGDEEQPLPTETAIAPTTIVPPSSLVFQPASAEVNGCTDASFRTQGQLQNNGAAVNNVRLDVLVTDGAGYVNSASVSPERIDSLGADESVGFTVQVDMNSNWANAVNQTVTVRVLLSHGTNGPVQENSPFDFTIHSNCETPPTGTPVVTETPNPNPTPEAPAAACTGANPQPTGMRLAAEFGVPYEEIMGWFCQKFGFGEISLAYELSQNSGVPVEDIFTMKRSGMGWGNIKKLVENRVPGTQITPPGKPGIGNNKDAPGKPEDPGKPEKTKKPKPNKK